MSDEVFLDRLGNKLEIGDKVLLLQIPILSEHEFIEGEVLQFSPKKVKVIAYIKDRYGTGCKKEVLRFCNQLVKVN